MKTVEFLSTLKADYQAQIDKATAGLALVGEQELVLASELKAQYDLGVVDGKASVSAPTDKVYTQAEFDQKLADSLSPIQAEFAVLKTQVEELTKGMDLAKTEAVEKFKAELAAKYAEFQVIEAQVETGFADLLKPVQPQA